MCDYTPTPHIQPLRPNDDQGQPSSNPESESVLQASNQGLPAIHRKDTDVSEAYQEVVARYLGEEKPLRFVDYEKPGLFKRLFGGK